MPRAFWSSYTLGFFLIDVNGKGQKIMVALVFITVSMDIAFDL